jgi:hypothetical protein
MMRRQPSRASRSSNIIISLWLRFGFLFLVGASAVSVLLSYKSSLLQDHATGSAVEQYLESSKERQRSSSSEAKHETAKIDSGSKGATYRYHEDNETSLATSIPPLEKILRQAMIFKGRHYDDEKLISELPSWPEIISLYGPTVKIHGLETCETFRKVPQKKRSFAVAGTFNSGTNLLSKLLVANCGISGQNEPTHWQVPW